MATITKGRTFTSGETVTPAKLNDVVDLATVTNIQTADIADGQVTAAKILDANVTNAKLASDIDASKLTTGTLPIARIADAAVTPAKLSQVLTLATAQNATSGTSIDFTGIPSWVKRITVMFSGVSTSGSSNYIIQLGDVGGFEITGYTSGADNSNGSGIVTSSAGFILTQQNAAATVAHGGLIVVSSISNNAWVYSSSLYTTTPRMHMGGGNKTLSDALTQLRITTVNGTDTFDAGSVNIMYEG
jgi:hypothetical protein